MYKPIPTDVCHYAKIRILKQITTLSKNTQIHLRCLSLCKDKNFKANHNIKWLISFAGIDVCHYAKIRILKQITTNLWYYYLEKRCLSLCKDKNFKANHNQM